MTRPSASRRERASRTALRLTPRRDTALLMRTGSPGASRHDSRSSLSALYASWACVFFFIICIFYGADVPVTDFDSLTSRSEEHTSDLPSLMRTSYAVFFLKKK